MGTPPPTKARQVLKKGEVRPFVLAGLDPSRRVAELTLPATRQPQQPKKKRAGSGQPAATAPSGPAKKAAKAPAKKAERAPAHDQAPVKKAGAPAKKAAKKQAKKAAPSAKKAPPAPPAKKAAKAKKAAQGVRREGAGEEGHQGPGQTARPGQEGAREEGRQGTSVMSRPLGTLAG